MAWLVLKRGEKWLFGVKFGLRYTKAIELLRAGVPVILVQDQLIHAYLTTTAVYLRISGQEAREILREIGLV